MMSTPPPSYTTNGQQFPPPPPVAGDVQLGYGCPYLHQQTTAGPVIYNAFSSRTPSKRVYDHYHGRQSVGLGVTMILAGLLCIIFNIVSVVDTAYVSIIGYGIWSGMIFIITGIFGVIVAKWKTMCKIVTFMVLCIVSSVFCFVLFVCSTMSAIDAKVMLYCGDDHLAYYDSYENEAMNLSHVDSLNYYPMDSSSCSTMITMEALQSCLALIVTICTIWGSVLCCKAVCCGAMTGQVLLPVQYIPMQQGNQPMMFYPSQEAVPQDSRTEIMIGGDMPSASVGSNNTPENFPYNPQLNGQGPPIYNEHKVPL